MDKRFLYSNFVDSDSKLTRTTSLSELSTAKKTVEQQYRSETCGNLVKQFSYEQIIEQQSNASHLKELHVSTFDNKQHTNNWNTRAPSFIVVNSFKNSRWPSKENEPSSLQKQLSLPTQYHSFRGVHDMDSQKVVIPSKLINKDSELKFLNNISAIAENNDGDYNQNISDSKILNESILKLKNTSLSDKKTDTINNSIQFVKNKNLIDNVKENFNSNNQNNQLNELNNELVVIERKKITYRNIYSSKIFIIIFPIFIALLVQILKNSDFLDNLCNPKFNLIKVSEELKNRIYGQDKAVNNLTKHLMEKHNQTGLDVIILVGGIGVGKSYTAEIIKNTLKDTMKLNNLDLFPPLYNKEDQVFLSLSICRCNLIRLENLKTDDVLDALHFIKNLRLKFPSYCILVLVLFNTEEIDYNLKRTMDLNNSVIMIHEYFEKINLQTTIVKYEPMSNEALIECIEDAAKHANVQLSIDEVDFVMNDLIAANSGCKGAYAKVQIVGKNVRKSSN